MSYAKNKVKAMKSPAKGTKTSKGKKSSRKVSKKKFWNGVNSLGNNPGAGK